jgi:hypothetical protein
VQLSAGARRDELRRLAVIALIYDRMGAGAAKRKRQSGEAPARSKHNTHDGRNPVS